MPTTINGIGTHYYGKQNVTTRTAACHSCGRLDELTSYDTRLWFVFLFIPVVPLGRKRIMDECPRCHRHFAADQQAYQQAQQETLTAVVEAYRSKPTVEAALAAHAQMLAFRAYDEASTFRTEILAKHPNDAPLYAGLGWQLDEVSQLDTARPLLERAYELDRTLPEARDGMARCYLADGRLDDARGLVSHLEQPGAGSQYPLATLYTLAQAYQTAGRHEETLDLCGQLLRELPDVKNNGDFRRLVRRSEKARPHADSLFADRSSWLGIFNPANVEYTSGQRWAAYLVLLAVLAVVVLAGFNEYYRQHRTVVVRNEFGPDAQVVIDGQLTLPPGKRRKIVLPEGTHHVSITGAIEDEFDVDMHTGYWQRWTNDPAWVINVGGLAQVAHNTLHYAEHPRPTETEVEAGKNVCFIPHVDYLFVSAPDSLKVDNKNTEITKHEVTTLREAPNDVFAYLVTEGPLEPALHYAESALLADPHDDDLLGTYISVVATTGQVERAKSLLASRLDQRPVLVDWHRYYQGLQPGAAERVKLLDDYDSLLAEEPDNAALLYLRGRITPSNRQADQFYDRAKAADPQFSWPWAAAGYLAYTQGDWQRCVDELEQARRRGHEQDVQQLRLAARRGLGQVDRAHRELRDTIHTSPPAECLPAVLLLAESMAGNGDLAGANRVVHDWRIGIPVDDRPTELLEAFRGNLEFNAGDFAAVERRVAAGTASPELKLHWLLATGQPEQAANDPKLAPVLENPWQALALGLAYKLADESSAADEWLRKATDALANGSHDDVQAAELLRADPPPTRDQVDDVGIQPMQKSLILAVLATGSPQQYVEYAALADQLSVEPSGFSPLVRQLVERGH